MKHLQTIVALGLLCAIGGTAIASDPADKGAQDKVVPVFVQVDAHGKVTSAVPAMRLSPTLNELMRKNLDEMIKAPATSHGKPVASQFVIMLSLKTTLRDKGNYSAQFTYLSTKPVPSGSWHWVNEDGRRWALARNSTGTYAPAFVPQPQHRSTPPPPHNNPPPQHPSSLSYIVPQPRSTPEHG